MSHFTPGLLIKTFQTKSGKTAELRYPQWQDLEMITDYINELSKEDTFVTFSGEKITKKDEAKYLSNLFVDHEFGDAVAVYCIVDGLIVGVSGIDRNLKNKTRGLHEGVFGLSVKKSYRGEGIGSELSKTVIEEAEKKMEGLKLVTLHVYSCNDTAIKLYKKLGFKEAGKLPGGVLYKGNYCDKVDMYLPL